MAGGLFGKNIEPSCKYCNFTMHVLDESGEVLCEKRGVVSVDYYCRKYEYDPLRRFPKKPPVLPSYTKEDFAIE